MSKGSSVRNFIKCEISPAAKAALADYCRSSGKSQIATLSRLIEFFSSSTPEIQLAIQGDLPDHLRPGVARLILNDMIVVKTSKTRHAAAMARKG